MIDNPRKNDPLVFQIGFSKCGTGSLYHLFDKSGTPSSHFHYSHKPEKEGECKGLDNLYNVFLGNFRNGIHPINGLDQSYAFFDIKNWSVSRYGRDIVYFHEFFPWLEILYPNAKFILNTRPVDNWIYSHIFNSLPCEFEQAGGWDAFFEAFKFQNKDQALVYYRNIYNDHLNKVRAYFINKKEKLIEFDIENDHPILLKEFFKDRADLNTDHWGKHNVTKKKNEEGIIYT